MSNKTPNKRTAGESHWCSASELREQLNDGNVSCAELTRDAIERCEALNPGLNALLLLDTEGALAQAESVDSKRAAGETLGLLAGMSVVVKDNLCTRGLRTTCASRILENFVAPYDAHVVERLRQEDAVILGKANMDEFAMGSSNEHSAFGAVRNPWNETCAPGGSSGGSAASVAAGLAPFALGSDTGGSVRQPAAFCGIPALKPTYGRVSRYGLVAFASSLDQVGPMARTVRDVSTLLQAIAGYDTRDATSIQAEVPDYDLAFANTDLKGTKIGVLEGIEKLEGIDSAVVEGMRAAEKHLQARGAELVKVSLPHAELGVAVYYLIAPSEASSNLSRFDGMRYGLRVPAKDLESTYLETRSQGFGDEVKRRIMLGTYALSAGYYDAYYLKAQKVRTLIRQDFEKAFATCDAILSPTTPTPAFRLGEKTGDPLAMYLADLFTLPASLAGLPALSVPVQQNQDGLPIGVQLVAPAFEESRLFTIGQTIEEEANMLDKHPTL